MAPIASVQPKEVLLLLLTASFVDIRDDDIPGPGTHNPNRLDKNIPSKWKFGKSTERDAFLEKYPRPNPPPNKYSTDKEAIIVSIIIMLRRVILSSVFPNQKLKIQQSTKKMMDQLETTSQSQTSQKPQHHTIALVTSNKWTIAQKCQLPTPTELTNLVYKPNQNLISTLITNERTQNNFTTAERPLPYGE